MTERARGALGVQMNLHSTLNSCLNRLVWLLTGHYARPGTNNSFVPLLGLSQSSKEKPSAESNARPTDGSPSPRPGSRSPVTGARIMARAFRRSEIGPAMAGPGLIVECPCLIRCCRYAGISAIARSSNSANVRVLRATGDNRAAPKDNIARGSATD